MYEYIYIYMYIYMYIFILTYLTYSYGEAMNSVYHMHIYMYLSFAICYYCRGTKPEVEPQLPSTLRHGWPLNIGI